LGGISRRVCQGEMWVIEVDLVFFHYGRRVCAVGEGVGVAGSDVLMREGVCGIGGDGVGPDYMGTGSVEVYVGDY
jgi:hypothetical protein